MEGQEPAAQEKPTKLKSSGKLVTVEQKKSGVRSQITEEQWAKCVEVAKHTGEHTLRLVKEK